MRRSTDRILTTHAGGLERPPELAALLRAKERGEPIDRRELDRRVADAVAEIVEKQEGAAIDTVNALIAERLESYASVFGRENVIASTDCGMGLRVGHPKICWAKFEAMAEGARTASQRPWG